MPVSFPALRPTSRTYTAPEYAQLSPQYLSIVSYPRLLGSKPGKAKLSLSFENIPDGDAALIIASWMNSLTGLLPLDLPPEVVSGIENSALATRIQTGQHLDWFFDGPPKQNSVIKGVSTVQVDLVGDIYMPKTSGQRADATLLLKMNGLNNSNTFVDSGTYNLTVVAHGNARISTEQSKFDGASGYFDGNNSYLSVTSSELAFANDDFTGEAWIYVIYSEEIAWQGIFTWPTNQGQSEYSGLYAYNYEEGFRLVWYEGVEGNYTESSEYLPYDTWHHVAAVRSTGVVSLFFNGTKDEATFTDPTPLNGSELRIGNNIYAEQYPEMFYGYIDELRLKRNEVLYSSNFTSPALPFS